MILTALAGCTTTITSSGNSGFPDAGLPDEAIVFPNAQWNDMGFFNARAIACVEVEVDPKMLPDDWLGGNRFFCLFFQVECTELKKIHTQVNGWDFGFAGPGVLNGGVFDTGGDVHNYWVPDAVGDVGYIRAFLTAEKLEDITYGWYEYSVKNEQTDEYDTYMHYFTSMPFGGLVVRERPPDFDYIIPPSAVLSIGEWSESATYPTVRVRTLAYDEYPYKPDSFLPEEKVFFVYFEAENTGSEALRIVHIYTAIRGSGVNNRFSIGGELREAQRLFFSFGELEPGAKVVYYEIIAAKSISDVQSIAITSREDIKVPFAF